MDRQVEWNAVTGKDPKGETEAAAFSLHRSSTQNWKHFSIFSVKDLCRDGKRWGFERECILSVSVSKIINIMTFSVKSHNE